MERFIIGEAGSGKTRKLLETAKELNAIVICKNPEAMRVKAQNYGLYRMDFYGYDEIVQLPNDCNVVIDEIGNFFKYGLRLNLNGFSITKDSK